MTVSVEKLAPRIVALAVAGFCVWPSIVALVVGTDCKPAAAKKSEPAAAKPQAKPPAATRDPFFDTLSLAAEAAQKAALQGKAAGSQGNDSLPGTAADPLAHLALEATCIMGNQRLAVINGRLYAPNDPLAADVAGGPNRRVVDVKPYAVLLDYDGKLKELNYADATQRRNPAKKSAAKGKKDKGGKTAEGIIPAEDKNPAAKKTTQPASSTAEKTPTP